ncbi:ABC transporter permease [Psychrilyobacter atlanticus]|uniref:ABC transporter permease n=1 Tax=Psychrilyobacter atlanticus TaxID=271091 RepID=UPI00042A2928|nr:ABC transporter permease [Psychrilyobacter atlanticus]
MDNRSKSPLAIMLKRFKRDRIALAALILLGCIALLALLTPLISKGLGIGPDDIDMDVLINGSPFSPGGNHILGTDESGRDIFIRLLYGSRISLTIGLVAVSISTTLGIIMGGAAGYYGGAIDNAIMRIIEVINVLPVMVLLITLIAITGPNIYMIMMVLGIVGWTGIARQIRGQLLTLREQEFMLATKALGLSDARKIFVHLVPNTISYLIISITLGMAGAILSESMLSFLGLVSPTAATWGNMINGARSIYTIQNYWWIWMTPGVAIFITVMCFNLVGAGLRYALDPKSK